MTAAGKWTGCWHCNDSGWWESITGWGRGGARLGPATTLAAGPDLQVGTHHLPCTLRGRMGKNIPLSHGASCGCLVATGCRSSHLAASTFGATRQLTTGLPMCSLGSMNGIAGFYSWFKPPWAFLFIIYWFEAFISCHSHSYAKAKAKTAYTNRQV